MARPERALGGRERTMATTCQPGGLRRILPEVALFVALWLPGVSSAQQSVADSGAAQEAARTGSAQRFTLLAVQQGLTALTPATAQSINYVYDPRLEVYQLNEKLGPTSFLTADTVGKGVRVMRASIAAFSLEDTVGVPSHFDSFDADGNFVGREEGTERIGIRAALYIFSLGFTYGIADRVDLSLSVPVVVTDVEGFSPGDPATGERFVFQKGSGFNAGGSVGLGLVSLGSKVKAFDLEWLKAAVSFELVLPSPNEKEFAGPGSVGLFPQLSLVSPLASWLSIGGSFGYNYELDDPELRRLAWKAGAWTSISGVTIDAGAAGAEFDKDVTFLLREEDFIEND